MRHIGHRHQNGAGQPEPSPSSRPATASSLIPGDTQGLEKFRLLGVLAHEDQSTTSIAVQGPSAADWSSLSGQFNPQLNAAITQMLNLTEAQRAKVFCDDPDALTALFQAVGDATNENVGALLAELIVNLGRSNTWFWDMAVETGSCYKLDFLRLLATRSSGADAYAYCLSALICHSADFAAATPELLKICLERRRLSTRAAELACVCNLLKVDDMRRTIAAIPEFVSLLCQGLHSQENPNMLYLAVFALWQLSSNPETMDCLKTTHGAKVVGTFADALARTKREKVIRVACLALTNLLEYDWVVEILSNRKLDHTMSLFEYEKWRDEDLYKELRDVSGKMRGLFSALSNSERYRRELESGRFTWSALHTEKFWSENYKDFEQNEFKAIKQLTALLNSSDNTTCAVACFDLGEFARLHPTGKQIMIRLRTKEACLQLMNHHNREVAREALLCVQKLMLDNWRQVGSEAQEKHLAVATGAGGFGTPMPVAAK